MHTIDLYDAPSPTGTAVKHAYTFPGGWEEVRYEHLLAIVRELLVNDDATRIKFNLLKELADIPAALMVRMPDAEAFTFPVDTTDRRGPYRPVETTGYQLLPQLDWCFGPPTYTRSLMPTLHHDGVEWTGPGDHFETMTLHQWCFCTELVKAFRLCTEPKPANDALDTLMGALYQPAHCSWRSEPIEEYAAKLRTLKPEVKLAAVMNYEAIHSNLARMYPRVFKPAVDGTPPSPQGLFSLAHDAAKSGAFVHYGGQELVEHKRLHLILGYMEHTLFADEQAEARTKQLEREARNA